VLDIADYGTEKYRWRKVEAVILQPLLGFFISHIRTREKKSFFRMLSQYVFQIFSGLFTKEYLTFTILNVLLQVKCYCLGYAEIFHIGRHVITHFFTNTEEMIHRIFTRKNNRCKICKIDFIFPHIFCRNAFYMNEPSKIQF